MASNVSEEEECIIPVFTVLKNNAIFKNIFILNKFPKPSPSKKSNDSSSSSVVQDHENTLLVGRHPDCDIMLTHPSISRFHLQIRSKPSSQSISIIDLSSVHGTWVSEKKVEPGVSVEMKEGDTLRVGASSRVYHLHWIPISRAYDLDDPFVSEVVVNLEAQNEKQEQVQGLQNFKCCPDEMEEIQSDDSILECIKLLFFDENLEVTVEKDIAVAPPMPEDTFSFCCPEDMKSPSKDGAFGFLSEPRGTGTLYLPTTSDWEKELCDSLNQELSVEKMEIPMPKGVICFCCEEEMRSQSNDEMFGIPNDPFGAENELCDSLNQVLALPYVKSSVECGSTLTEYLSESVFLPVVEAVQGTNMQQLHTTLDTFSSTLPPDPATFDGKCAAEAVVPEESKCGYTVRDDERVRDTAAATEIFNSEKMFLQVEEVVCDIICQQNKVVVETAIDSLCNGKEQDTCGEEHKAELLSHLNAKYCSLDESVQDIGNKCKDSISLISNQIESVNLSTPQKAVLKITKEDPLPQTDMEYLENHGETMEQKSTIGNIWSKRGKAVSAPQVRTSKSTFKSKDSVDIKVAMSNVKDMTKTISEDCFSVLDDGQEEEEIFTPDKENFSPKDLISKTVSKDLFSHFDEEEEICTPDKENLSPNTHLLWLLKKNRKLKETKFSEWSQKSKENSSPNIYPDVRIGSTSNKENQTLNVVLEQKSRRKPFGSHINMAQDQGVTPSNRVERVPFQVLNNPGGKSKSRTSYPVSTTKSKSRTSCPVSATKSIGISDSGQILDKHINFSDIIGDPKESWDMVVDAASLMNRKSRKALQLLQGLKGTRLIIPRLVIGELNHMKKQFSIFRRISEASLALEWIEECMAKTNWWIHIQSSMEEECMIVPIPPAFPRTHFSLQSLSFHNSSVEVALPTVEDDILDFVLLYKRKQNDGQLVLLSEDVTLKIKCMAEGLLCESVQVFRDSLVNPFSERFLWANSSPRGQTWSCQDDVVLREKYCPFLSKKSSKGAASGLKLILLHNSQYKR